MRNRNLLNQKLETLNATLTNLRRIVNTQEPIETYKINIATEIMGEELKEWI